MQYGTIVKFFPAKGFGFIRPDFGPDVFFHVTALGACQEKPLIEPGQMVKYELIPRVATPAEEQTRPRRNDKPPVKRDEPARPEARFVELTDSLPSEITQRPPDKEELVRHPRARKKKPTWRR